MVVWCQSREGQEGVDTMAQIHVRITKDGRNIGIDTPHPLQGPRLLDAFRRDIARLTGYRFTGIERWPMNGDHPLRDRARVLCFVGPDGEYANVYVLFA